MISPFLRKTNFVSFQIYEKYTIEIDEYQNCLFQGKLFRDRELIFETDTYVSFEDTYRTLLNMLVCVDDYS